MAIRDHRVSHEFEGVCVQVEGGDEIASTRT